MLLKSGSLACELLLDDSGELEFSIPLRFSCVWGKSFSEPLLGLLCEGLADPFGVRLPGLIPPRINVTSASCPLEK